MEWKKQLFINRKYAFYVRTDLTPFGTYSGTPRVSNVLSFANFDLIFLHDTNILFVRLSVGLFVFLVCLSCLSVCLSVCMSV